MARLEGQQASALPEGTSRIIGRDAQRTNIAIGYAIASIVRTTLGPKGMDKMLVSDLGDIVITNDGATILEEMNVEHPTAKIMVEIAKTQDKEVGDGTTTAVVFMGELCKEASKLLDQNLHPSTIIKGYTQAASQCEKYLNELSHNVSIEDTEALEKIAQVSMGSKAIGVGSTKAYLADLVVKAIKQVAEKKDGKYVIDEDLIKIEKKAGGEISDTQLIQGVLIDKEVVHSGMPKQVKDAKIALIDAALEIEKTEMDAKIEITSPEQMSSFLAQEEKILKEMVEKIVKAGANVLFCQKGIDDMAQHFLAKNKILAVRRVKKSDMEKLSRATNGRIVSTLDDLSPSDLGYAGLVYEETIAGEKMVFVEKCKDPKSVTLFVRSSTEHVVAETERAVVDAIGAVSSSIEDGKFVTGGGSIEMALSTRLKKYAAEVGGREQLAISAFADSLEIIPRTLAESAGMDAIDALVELRAKHQKEDGKYYGINVFNSKVEDLYKLGVFEPTKVKRQAIASAAEAARMILRIDDMISSKPKPSSPKTPGMEEGME
ncbi:MAG: thermosome subunit beta [Candidatus Anstonellaceae archaeon]